ncbi:hypothetical protein PG993_012396 [Apiospora rasikravindrae]|uniref:Uncharacterized protein n=1 Tax=Apiospora rasikravindrae TaxID=990691 RepID=A0ABR1S2B2_9PEZI
MDLDRLKEDTRRFDQDTKRLKADRDRHEAKLFDLRVRTTGVKADPSQSELMNMVYEMERERKDRGHLSF